MFYKNIPTFNKKYKYKMYDTLNDAENVLINFGYKNGALVDSYGEDKFNCFIDATLSTKVYPEMSNLNNIIDIYYFEGSQSVVGDARKQLLAITNDYKLYATNVDDGSVNYTHIHDLPQNCKYKILQCSYHGDNYCIISTNTQDEVINYYYKGNNIPLTQYSCDYYFYDICNHNSQLFMVMDDNRNKILFAEDVNPINLQSIVVDREQIYVPTSKGKILKLISNGDYLFVICEYGILRITTYINQKKYYMDELYSGNSKIIEQSIVVAGNTILFVDSDGMKIFDGNNIESVNSKYNFLVNSADNINSVGCVVDNKYFFSTRINDENYFDIYDVGKNNALFIYNIGDKCIELCSGISIKKLITYCDNYSNRIAILSGSIGIEQLYTLSNTGKYDYDKIAVKKLISKTYDIQKPEKKKIFKKLYIKTSEDILISINADGCLYEYLINGSDEIQNILLNISSYEFNIILSSSVTQSDVQLLKILVGENE